MLCKNHFCLEIIQLKLPREKFFYLMHLTETTEMFSLELIFLSKNHVSRPVFFFLISIYFTIFSLLYKQRDTRNTFVEKNYKTEIYFRKKLNTVILSIIKLSIKEKALLPLRHRQPNNSHQQATIFSFLAMIFSPEFTVILEGNISHEVSLPIKEMYLSSNHIVFILTKSRNFLFPSFY